MVAKSRLASISIVIAGIWRIPVDRGNLVNDWPSRWAPKWTWQ